MRKFAYLSLLTLLALTTCQKAGDEPKEVPMAPTELTLAQESGNQIKLTWKDNANNETGFKIERAADREEVYQLIGTVGANTTTYTDNNAPSGTRYEYRVYAYNATGKSVEYSINGIEMCPVVVTDRIDNISFSYQTQTNSASVFAAIVCQGVSPFTSMGIVWSTSPNPTVSLSTKTSINLFGPNGFWFNMTNLSLNSTYYIRAYASNSLGTTYGNEKVFKTQIIGKTVAGGNGRGGNSSQLSWPSGVARDKDGNIFVADFENHRVQKWAPGATSGTTVAGGNAKGSAANQLDTPTGVCLDAAGNIYVADHGNHRVQKWAPGATSGTTVAGGNTAVQLNFPTDVFIDGTGNMYVTDLGSYGVRKWAPDANSAKQVAGGSGVGSSGFQLNTPLDLIVDLNGNIYIADAGNSRIQKWVQ